MSIAILAVVVLHLSLEVWLWLSSRKGHGDGLTKRARRRNAYAAQAVAYAEKMGGSAEVKLSHAMHCFRLLDEADNGRRDYSDAEARMAIEATLHIGVNAK